MLKTVLSVELPVGEMLQIKKQSLTNGDSPKRLSVVTGTHGDELEGQYVCYELIRRIEEEREKLNGTVDIYPALNPLGIDSSIRSVPLFDVDLNRMFPGNPNRSLPSFMANRIVRELDGSDLCIDIHSSNIFLREVPQVRINEIDQEELVPLAKRINIDFIWVHGEATVLESTLAYSLNHIGVPTLVVEMGVGLRLTREYGDRLVDGIFTMMKDMGMWRGETVEPKPSTVSIDPEEICFLNAPVPGLFIPAAAHNSELQAGDKIGAIVDPFTGKIKKTLTAEADGWLFTLREFPNVYEGSLVARMLRRGGAHE